MMMPQESDLSAEEGIPVEVKLLDNGGYYEAFLMDMFKDEALIRFPMNWIEETRLPLSLIRFPPDKDAKEVEVKENMVAEAYLHKQPGVYKGWFKCVVKVIKSSHCQMEYLGDNSGVDFVSNDMLRPFNDKPSLSWDMLHVHTVSIPKEIQEYASTEGVHNDLKVGLKDAIINYDSDNHEVIIVSPNEADISRAKVLEKAYLRSLTQKASVLHLKGKLIRPIEKAENGRFVEEFTISGNLISSAIGKEQANLRAAKNIEGVSYVRFVRKSKKFIICGETEKAVRKARELLEIRMEYYYIPESEMSKIVGKNSNNIYTIVEATGVVEIFIPKSKDVPEKCIREGFLPLAVVGTSKAITRAKGFIDFQLDHINEVSNLRRRQMKIIQDINDYFKKSSSISTDSRTDLTINNSEVVQSTAESTSQVGVYAFGEVQEMSLQSQIEENLQINNWGGATSFQGGNPNALTETELEICDCRDNSDTTKKGHLETQRESLKSYSSKNLIKFENKICSDISSCDFPNCSHLPEVTYQHQGYSVTSTTVQMQNLLITMPSSYSPSFPLGDRQITEITAPNSSPLSNNSSTFASGNLQITEIESFCRNAPSFALDDRHLTKVQAPSSNTPGFVSGDMQITLLKRPSSNSPSFASGDTQTIQEETPRSNPFSNILRSIHPQRLTLGDVQSTPTEIANTKISKERDPLKSGYPKQTKLINLLQSIGYDGPMLNQIIFNAAIQVGIKSPAYIRLIVYLTEEIRKLKFFSARITPMTNPFSTNIVFDEFGELLRQTICAFSDWLPSKILWHLETSSSRRMVIKFLAFEIIYNRFHQSCAKLSNLEKYMIMVNLNLNVDAMLRYLNIPIEPSEGAYQAMVRAFTNCDSE